MPVELTALVCTLPSENVIALPLDNVSPPASNSATIELAPLEPAKTLTALPSLIVPTIKLPPCEFAVLPCT